MKHCLNRILALTLLCGSSVMAAEKDTATERYLKALEGQREQEAAAALEPINRRYQQSLEQLLRRALQDKDMKAAAAIQAAIDMLPQEVAKQIPGEWRMVASTGWTGDMTLRANGTGSHANGSKIQWRVEHGILYLGPGPKADRLYLPIVDGKLTGMNSLGNGLTLTKK